MQRNHSLDLREAEVNYKMKESLKNFEKCIKEKQSIDRAYSTINIENEKIKSSRDEVDLLRKSTTLDLAQKGHLIDDNN